MTDEEAGQGGAGEIKPTRAGVIPAATVHSQFTVIQAIAWIAYRTIEGVTPATTVIDLALCGDDFYQIAAEAANRGLRTETVIAEKAAVRGAKDKAEANNCPTGTEIQQEEANRASPILEARNQLWDRLMAGECIADGFPVAGNKRVVIPAVEWKSMMLNPGIDGLPEVFYGNGRGYDGVFIPQEQVRKYWRGRPRKPLPGSKLPELADFLTDYDRRRKEAGLPSNNDDAKRAAEEHFAADIGRETIREIRRERGLKGEVGRPLKNSAKK